MREDQKTNYDSFEPVAVTYWQPLVLKMQSNILEVARSASGFGLRGLRHLDPLSSLAPLKIMEIDRDGFHLPFDDAAIYL